jgi:protein-tyrosine-phosphatase
MPTILVVCTANICRSPMAEVFLREALASQAGRLPAGEWVVRSAGTWARDGLPAASGSMEAMASRGFDLSPHRSHLLGREDVLEADLILVMTAGHREAILAEFPAAAGRVHLLSRMSGPPFDIADPFGGAQAEYEACAAELQALSEAGFERIVELAAANAAAR